MTKFYLVRHGEAQYDLAENRRLIGAMRDLVPLTGRGREQATQAAERLAAEGIRLVLSSPMTRAMQTAHILAQRLRVPLQVEFDLHEWLPDLSCSYDTAAFAVAQAAELARFGGEWPEGQQLNWEPLSAVRSRVLSALVKYTANDKLALAIHGTVIYALTGQRVGNGEIVVYELPDSTA